MEEKKNEVKDTKKSKVDSKKEVKNNMSKTNEVKNTVNKGAEKVTSNNTAKSEKKTQSSSKAKSEKNVKNNSKTKTAEKNAVEKKEKKTNNKEQNNNKTSRIDNKLKITLSILVIILVSAISFGGIYVQDKGRMNNIIPEYLLGMDLEGARKIGIIVDDTVNKVIYDKDGKVVTEEGEGTTTKEEPVNPAENLTKENFEKSKEIVNKRLQLMNVADYTIGLNEENGTIMVDMIDNADTDMVAQYMYMSGKFEITDPDGNVLLNNSHIDKATVKYGYVSSNSNATTVFLSIQFNKEGTEKLKEISNTYVKSVDEEGNDNSKKIKISIDGVTLVESAFEQENKTGELQLSIGQASTTSAAINEYIRQASNLAVLLNSGELPITYTLDVNRFVYSEIPQELIYIVCAAIGAIILVTLLVMIIKYKKNGFLAAIAFIGYIACLLMAIRYTNVMLTIDGLIAIVASIIINFTFTFYLLSLIKKNYKEKERVEVEIDFQKAFIRILWVLIPLIIVTVILCFANWLPLYSFGMVMFWGIITLLLYNIVITRTLLVNTVKDPNNKTM